MDKAIDDPDRSQKLSTNKPDTQSVSGKKKKLASTTRKAKPSELSDATNKILSREKQIIREENLEELARKRAIQNLD